MDTPGTARPEDDAARTFSAFHILFSTFHILASPATVGRCETDTITPWVPAMNRDVSVDLVRIIGIVAIVAGHTLPGRELNELLFIWHVPLFFFLSGYLWSPGRTMKDEWHRRSATLLKPYAFWFTVIFVPFLAGALLADDDLWDAIMPAIYGGLYAVRPFTTFWFVLALFATALLWRLLEKVPVTVRVIYVAAAVAVAPLIGAPLAQTPLALGTSLLAVVFLALGEGARRLEPRLRGAGPWVGLTLTATGLALVALHLVAPFGLKQGAWGTPIVSVLVGASISWGLVLAARPIGRLLSTRVAALVTTLALPGLTVVLAHPAVLWVLDRFGLPDTVLFLAALLVPWVVGLVALRTPISQWVTGTPRLTSGPAKRL